MTKPNDIPQDVWDNACSCVPDYVKVTIKVTIARAIMKAKEEERKRCARVVEHNCTIEAGKPLDPATPYILEEINQPFS